MLFNYTLHTYKKPLSTHYIYNIYIMTQFSTAKNLTNWDEGLGFIYANGPLSVSFKGCPYSIRETEK